MALGLVDDEGLEALTVRRLAAAVGTASASLYRHVASREELLVLLVDHVLGGVRLPPQGRSGRAKVVWLTGELRRVLMGHPNLVPALGVSPLLGPNAMRGTEHGLAGLLEAGYGAETAVAAYFALIDYVLGTVFFDTSSSGRRAGGQDAVHEWIQALEGERLPTLWALRDTFARPSEDEIFSFGLRAFLDGLDQRFLADKGLPHASGDR